MIRSAAASGIGGRPSAAVARVKRVGSKRPAAAGERAEEDEAAEERPPELATEEKYRKGELVKGSRLAPDSVKKDDRLVTLEDIYYKQKSALAAQAEKVITDEERGMEVMLTGTQSEEKERECRGEGERRRSHHKRGRLGGRRVAKKALESVCKGTGIDPEPKRERGGKGEREGERPRKKQRCRREEKHLEVPEVEPREVGEERGDSGHGGPYELPREGAEERRDQFKERREEEIGQQESKGGKQRRREVWVQLRDVPMEETSERRGDKDLPRSVACLTRLR